jgi:hypothetical protein
MSYLNLMRLCDALHIPRSGPGRERWFDERHAMKLVLAWQMHIEHQMPIAVAAETAAKPDPNEWIRVLNASMAGSDETFWLAHIRTGAEPDVRILNGAELAELLTREPLKRGFIAQPLNRAVHGVIALAKQKAPAA